MNLFQHFLSFLDEKTQHETASHNKERDKNIRPRRIQTTNIQPEPTPHASPSNQNTQGTIIRKLTAIQQQIERMQQTKNDQNQQHLPKKPETRACFRCGKIGHVAKFCRSKPSSKTLQPNCRTQLFEEQMSIRPRHRKQLYPTSQTSSFYDPLHNWQLPTLQSRKNISSRTTKSSNKYQINQSSPQKLDLPAANHSQSRKN